MSIFYRLFPTKDVKIALQALDQADEELGYNASFFIIEKIVRKDIYKNPKTLSETLNSVRSPMVWAFMVVATKSRDLLENSEFYLTRGIINPISSGADFKNLYFKALDKLVEQGIISNSEKKRSQKSVLELIKELG